MNKLFFFFFFFFSCDQVYLPKQKAFFAHQFPSPNYILSNNREKKLCKYLSLFIIGPRHEPVPIRSRFDDGL